jgi:hypothetical protein
MNRGHLPPEDRPAHGDEHREHRRQRHVRAMLGYQAIGVESRRLSDEIKQNISRQ